MGVHIVIIAITVLFSISAFNNSSLISRFEFNAWSIIHRKEYVRLLSHGFLHADWMHLLINMFVLYSFSDVVIAYFDYFFQGKGTLLFLFLYVTALVISSLYSLFKERNNPNYNALGASGAVSAVVFTSIFFAPYAEISIYGIIPIKGIILGVLYLIYSKVMAKKRRDNIGHDAHFYGAVYGFIFPLLFKPSLFLFFIDQLIHF